MLFINVSTTSAMMFTSNQTKRHLLVSQHDHLGRSILTEKSLKYNEKVASACRKHCHQQNHPVGFFYFSLIGNATNNYHLQLKESLVVLKLKSPLKVAFVVDIKLFFLWTDFAII